MLVPDFKDYVKKRPEKFFGDRGVNALDICTEIARGAVALGCKKVQIGVMGSWHYICADQDWFTAKLRHEYRSQEDIFEKMQPFPEYFVNSTRYEPLANFYSDALVTSTGKVVKIIKGKESDARLFETEISSSSEWQRVIAFRFNEQA